jgi:hypothetical protein
MSAPVVDWDALRKYGPLTIECRCGRQYRTLFKLTMHADTLVGITETPCPGCGSTQDHVKRASSDPETWTLGGA